MKNYFEHLKKKFVKDFDFIIESRELDEKVLMDRTKYLLPHVATKLGKKEEDIRRCLTKLELIKTPVINGYADTQDDWKTFQIYMSWGIMIFLIKMIKLFISRMSVTNGKRIVDEAIISDQEMIDAVKRLMLAFWGWEGTFWQARGIALIDLTKSQIELSAYLLHYAECFILAHEFGHLIMGSCPETVEKELYIASAATEDRNRTFLESLRLTKEDRKRALEEWPKELAADLIGLQLCLEQRDDNIGRIVIRSSAEFLFISMLMLERFSEKYTGESYWSYMYEIENKLKHPPTGLRLDFLHSFVDRSNISGESHLGRCFRQWSEHILSTL